MKQIMLLMLMLGCWTMTTAQNPLVGNMGGAVAAAPSHVGGSVSVDVNNLISTQDAQRLLDNLGSVTVHYPIQSYYPNTTPGTIDLIRKATEKGLLKGQVSGNSMAVALTDKGRELLVETETQKGITIWHLAVGLCEHPLAAHTTLGTSNGRPGQTLTFSLNIDINTTLGDILGFRPEDRKDNFTVDLIPTSSGWIIDQTSLNLPIKQASASSVGNLLLRVHKFVKALPKKLQGKTWTRQHKKEDKRYRHTFRADGTCTYYDAKISKEKKGSYNVKSNQVFINFLDGDKMTLIIDYKKYGEDWLAMVPKGGLIWSVNAWKFYATSE